MDLLPATHHEHSPSNLRELLLTGCGTVLVLALAIVFFIFLENFKSDPIPQNVRAQASYPLYWASYIPSGFKPTSQGYTNAPDKSVQVILEDNSHNITIAQLAAPQGYNPLAAYNQEVSAVTTSPLGIIYNLSFKTSYRYAVNTGKTMIFITSTNTKVTQLTAKQIMDGLKRAG